MLSCNSRKDNLSNFCLEAGNGGHHVHSLTFVDMARNGQNNRGRGDPETTNLIINLVVVGFIITQVWYQNSGNNFVFHMIHV